MLKFRVILLLCLLLAAVPACDRNSETSEKADESATSVDSPTAKTPAESPNIDFGQERSADAKNIFTIVVKNAFLFQGGQDPFARNLTREKGICLVAVGSIRNDSDKIFHRGGIFGTLKAAFEKNVVLEKHTGGLGFIPEISSTKPWRPDEWRDFRLVTRALDPIYVEFTPKSLEAEIVIEVRDPLKFQLRQTLSSFKLPWRTLLGAQVEGSAAIMERITPISFEKAGSRRFQEGDLVTLQYQKGAGYKILGEDNLGGWVPYRALALDLKEFRVKEQPQLPLIFEEPTFTLKVTKVIHAGTAEPGETEYALLMDIVNKDPKQTLAVRPVDFMIEFGPSDAPNGKLDILEDRQFKSSSGNNQKPESTETYRYTVVTDSTDRPLEMVWLPPHKDRVSLPLP